MDIFKTLIIENPTPQSGGGGGSGTVTSVQVTTANGVSGTVANPTTTPDITLSLGAITPSSVAATGTVTGSNLSGTNTGDQTITLTSDVTGSGTGSFATTIANGVVSNTKLADVATATIKGRTTSGTGSPEDLTGTQATALLDTFTSSLKGLAPASGGGTSNFLRADGTWAAPSGGGSGTVTSVSVTTANGVSGTVANPTTTPAISLTLGAITPSSVAATGTVTGSNLSGTNTGDQTISITGDVTASGSTGALSSTVTKINGTSLAGLGTGILKNTTGTGVPSIAVAADFPTLNQNTTGTASNVTGTVAVANGGTGVTTTPTNGQLLIGNGTGYSVSTLTGGSGITITNTAGGITVASTGSTSVETITATVTNAEATAITLGQVVYAFGATGNRMSVKLASNTSDATSAKTIGVVSDASIAANGTGTITILGEVTGLSLNSYSDGDTLYLGATAGTFTNVKPYAPNHLVYVGVVERANNGNGELYVRIQNGYELDEIHDVQITTPPAAGAVLIRDATNSLWKAATLTAGTGITITNGNASSTIGLTSNSISIAGNSTALGGSVTQDQITGLSSTGIVKRTGANTLTTATAGTDYLTPTGSGASLTGITATQVGLGNVSNDTQTKAAIVPNTAPSAGQILVGNAGGTAYAPVSSSGDVTVASTGAFTIGASKVTNAMLAGSIDLTTKVTGALPIANGGTAATTAPNAATNLGLGTASNVTFNTVSDAAGNLRTVVQNSKTSAYTLVVGDCGKHISITTGGVTVPSGVFSAGDVVSIYNNSASNQTITQGASVTMYLAGTATTGNRTLAQRGLCTVMCVASNTFVIMGGGLT